MYSYPNMDTFCKLLTVLVISFIIYTESGDTSCQFIQKENKTIQVCREQSMTSDEIYLDSDGAPDGNITCWCTMERSQNLTVNVIIDSRIIRYGDGIQFQISNDGDYERIYDATQERKKKQIVLQDYANITFRKTSTRANSAICLSLKAAGSSANFTVMCHQHQHAAEDNNERETEPSSTITELPTTGSKQHLPVDQGNTILIPVVASSAAAVLLATIVVTVIICRKCRLKKDQTSETMKQETTNVRRNQGHEAAGGNGYPAEQQHYMQLLAREDQETDTYADLLY